MPPTCLRLQTAATRAYHCYPSGPRLCAKTAQSFARSVLMCYLSSITHLSISSFSMAPFPPSSTSSNANILAMGLHCNSYTLSSTPSRCSATKSGSTGAVSAFGRGPKFSSPSSGQLFTLNQTPTRQLLTHSFPAARTLASLRCSPTTVFPRYSIT